MSLPPDHRAVITGRGALSPFGTGVPALWRGLIDNRSALRSIELESPAGRRRALAGAVPDFDPRQALSPAECRRFDRITQFAVTAGREALADARLDPAALDSTRMGVIVATSLGGMLIGERYQQALHARQPFAARELLHMPYYALATRVARAFGARGPVASPSIACASGTQAIGMALEYIRSGQGDVFIVGGAETLCEFVVSGFGCLRALTTDVVRPFDARRNGLLLGEGAAILIIESLAHARRRGIDANVEVAGSGLAGDAVHMTAPARDGAGAARAMRAALDDAEITPMQIDFISAHGTGTVYNDAMEIAAIEAVWGAQAGAVPVNSIKGAIGHTLGAAGSFEAIMCVDVLRRGIIPPTANCRNLEAHCRLDVVRDEPRHRRVSVALSTSSAFAGNNAAIVLRAV